MATTKNTGSTNDPENTTTETSDLAASGAVSPHADSTTGGSTGSTDTSGSTSDTGERKVDQGPLDDPTDPEQAGDAAITIEDGDNRDFSDPQQNANVGYSAEGQVVSNQQGEQVNTVQASEDERNQVVEDQKEQAKTADPWSDPNVTNQA